MNASHSTIPPMPDTHCPRWCLEDHRGSWEDWVGTALHPRPIPAEGGGFVTGPGTPFDEWIAQWEPYHCIRVAQVELYGHERVDVDLSRSGDSPTYLYLDGRGAMTAEQARSLALALLNAVDELEKAHAGQ